MAIWQQRNILPLFLYIIRKEKSTSAVSPTLFKPSYLENYHWSVSLEWAKFSWQSRYLERSESVKGFNYIKGCNKTTTTLCTIINIHMKKGKFDISSVSYIFYTIIGRELSLKCLCVISKILLTEALIQSEMKGVKTVNYIKAYNKTATKHSTIILIHKQKGKLSIDSVSYII